MVEDNLVQQHHFLFLQKEYKIYSSRLTTKLKIYYDRYFTQALITITTTTTATTIAKISHAFVQEKFNNI